MTTPRVFVSHSHVDSEWCQALVAALRQQGCDAWFEQANLVAGDTWFNVIQRELVSREIFVVVLTPDAAESYWVNKEIETAFAAQHKVIPILLKPTTLEVGFLSTVQWIKVGDRDATAIAAEVVTAIQNKLPPPVPVAPAPKVRPAHPKGPWAVAPAHKAITAYYATLAELRKQGVTNEQGLRPAFQTLLGEIAREVKWTLIPEAAQANRNVPDGTLRDEYTRDRGFWEAKDTKDDLALEITKKFTRGYLNTNTIFEDTRQAYLFQGSDKAVMEIDLADRDELAALLTQFFTHTQPVIEEFDRAVSKFKDEVPRLAQGLLGKIDKERKQHNTAFTSAFADFRAVCQQSIAKDISDAEIDEMLVQHLLTERLFRTVFNNPEFVGRNVIAREIERVIAALTSREFNRADFEGELDRFYVAIEDTARTKTTYADKQTFMNTVYERFFQGFAVREADTHGIVYTPQPIVDFMCASVEEVLQREFRTSLSEPGVQILDPATGTGNFIVNLLRRVKIEALDHKYAHDLFCNEIMLLPYYIASMNIEHAYFARAEHYQPFQGVCFADTLLLQDGVSRGDFVQQELTGISQANSERVTSEQKAEIMVVIGNPPYNAKQANENDNNQNRNYPDVEGRIRATYSKDSQATNRNTLGDAYVKFFRWASDRLRGRDGIVCFVTNNSFVHKVAFDGMRKHLLEDFTQIWHLDLGGNSREGESGNVFGIRVGVGITIAIRASQNPARGLWYYSVPPTMSKQDRLDFLQQNTSNTIPWQELTPDEETHQWLTEGMRPEFATYLSVGSKMARSARSLEVQTIFKSHSNGVKTNRDDWAYDFDREALAEKMLRFIETYNVEVDRWHRRADTTKSLDDFVIYDDSRIKWSESLKFALQRKTYATFNQAKIRPSLYRPFCKEWLFFDRILNERVYQFPFIFPTIASEQENNIICVTGMGSERPFTSLASNIIVDLNMLSPGTGGAQCFPYYTYAEDGSNRQENITDWALAQFQAAYGAGVTKRDVFHYVYAVLHHPQYRERYAENLKRELPRVPLIGATAPPLTPPHFSNGEGDHLLPPQAVASPPLHRSGEGAGGWGHLVAAGAELAALHVGYEAAPPFALVEVVDQNRPYEQRVSKMKLSGDKRTLVVNESITLTGIPERAFAYRLGNRSALEWVLDQYQVTTDKRSGITSDPNRADDPGYIVRLVKQVVQVSVETMRIVDGLPDLGLPQ